MPQPSITKIRLKITYLNFHSNFPGANELMPNTLGSGHGLLFDLGHTTGTTTTILLPMGEGATLENMNR